MQSIKHLGGGTTLKSKNQKPCGQFQTSHCLNAFDRSVGSKSPLCCWSLSLNPLYVLSILPSCFLSTGQIDDRNLLRSKLCKFKYLQSTVLYDLICFYIILTWIWLPTWCSSTHGVGVTCTKPVVHRWKLQIAPKTQWLQSRDPLARFSCSSAPFSFSNASSASLTRVQHDKNQRRWVASVTLQHLRWLILSDMSGHEWYLRIKLGVYILNEQAAMPWIHPAHIVTWVTSGRKPASDRRGSGIDVGTSVPKAAVVPAYINWCLCLLRVGQITRSKAWTLVKTLRQRDKCTCVFQLHLAECWDSPNQHPMQQAIKREPFKSRKPVDCTWFVPCYFLIDDPPWCSAGCSTVQHLCIYILRITLYNEIYIYYYMYINI